MSYTFNSSNGEIITLRTLTPEYCKDNCKEILEIINIIPHISWSTEELFFENDYFGNKWNYSLAAVNSANKVVGVLIAYFRMADNRHILDSLYIHKLAVRKDYQDIGIGTEMLRYFIFQSYKCIPWLLNITVQTNNSYENQYVIDFYKKMGFIDFYKIPYPDKTDILFVLERKKSQYDLFIKEAKQTMSPLHLYHPRLKMIIDAFSSLVILPVVYFSSTNARKKEMVQFIFNNYNIDVVFLESVIPLTEPQVESSELKEEQNLVSFPLKLASRFIKKVPYVIEDTMLFVEFFNRNGQAWELPGHDTKRWWRQLGAQGILSVMGDTNKRAARFVSQTGAYMKANEYSFGRGEITGHISTRITPSPDIPQKGTYPYFFHTIFIPDGATKTLAEMDMFEFAKYDYIRKSIVSLISKLEYSYDFYDNYTFFTI